MIQSRIIFILGVFNMINRPFALQKLTRFKDKQLIKVVTGIRRSGKSTLLELFRQQLLTQGVNPATIQSYNFEDLSLEPLTDYHRLYDTIVSLLQNDWMNYVFIDEILTTLPLEPTCVEDKGCIRCGQCRKACPGGAITDGVCTEKCASHISQKKGELSREETEILAKAKTVFGCDICQSVCPFNQHAPLHRNPQFDPIITPEMLSAESLETMTEEEFCAIAKDTPLLRAGFERIKANANK
jgi:ferredoxin